MLSQESAFLHCRAEKKTNSTLSTIFNFRDLHTNDIESIVDIHLLAFKDFFLTSLGKRFLKAYYKACLNDTESISLCVINQNNQIEGFAIGCLQSLGFHKRILIRNFPIFFQQAIIILFESPRSLIRLMHNFEKNNNKNDNGKYTELLSIAVMPKNKGLGLGKKLLDKFEEIAKQRGSKKITLTTDYYNNQDVIHFYQKNGYLIYYDFTTFPDRKMYKFFKILT